MTYCVGWKYLNSVYLMADSALAVTGTPMPIFGLTSFGQTQTEQSRQGPVSEMGLKIIRIKTGAVVAFAGRLALAEPIIECLISNAATIVDTAALFDSMSKSIGPFGKEKVEILWAASTASSQATELIRWDTEHGFSVAVDGYAEIGSLTSYHPRLVRSVISNLSHYGADNMATLVIRRGESSADDMLESVIPGGELSADDMLASAIAIVQSLGVTDNLMAQNVGGVVVGIRSFAGNATWQEDTRYVLYDPALATEIDRVSVFIRDDAVVVRSTLLTPNTKIFGSKLSKGPHGEQWMSKWQQKIDEELETDRFRYWIFLSTAANVITVLRKTKLNRPGRLCGCRRLENGQIAMSMNNTLRADLQRQPDDIPGEGVPISFRFGQN